MQAIPPSLTRNCGRDNALFAVIAYFWPSWVERYFDSVDSFRVLAKLITVATVFTGVIGIALMLFIERVVLRGSAHAEVEHLFGNPYVIATGLATVGVMIILSARHEATAGRHQPIGTYSAAWIGAVQGLCLPFRGFSRSGATISTGLFLGLEKRRVAEFSFALAVVLTPAIIAKEGYRLLRVNEGTLTLGTGLFDLVWPSHARHDI